MMVNHVTMNQYLLLRDNKESGPYSLEELSSLGLRPFDLIWVEKTSMAWEYAPEMEELKAFVNHEEKLIPRNSHSSERARNVFISLPSDFSRSQQRDLNNNFSPNRIEEKEPLETRFEQSVSDLRERYNDLHQNKPVWQKRKLPLTNLMNAAAVFIGLILGAFIIKKTVDGFGSTISETEAAVPATVIELETSADQNYQNALTKEDVPEVTGNVEKALPKSVKPKDIKRQVKVKTNKYKVGLFGGINGLQFKVYNASPHLIDNLSIVVDYLKPNGDVVETEQYQLSSVKPMSFKTLDVPSNKRGVKINYRVINIYSKEYKAALKQI